VTRVTRPVPSPPDGAGPAPSAPARAALAPRPGVSFMLRHPARLVALGFGSGLSPVAPGTAGTLWAWAVFALLDRWLDTPSWWAVVAASLVLGTWACTRTALDLGLADPGAIVWDEVVAFWIVLLVVAPYGFWAQLAGFALFRGFDAAKPGPVAWADRLLEHRPEPWLRGAGILLDDLVAAGCTLLVMAMGAAVLKAAW
jgi:phosphatidylglycerophosphatase A